LQNVGCIFSMARRSLRRTRNQTLPVRFGIGMKSGAPRMPDAVPIVFIVDDDVSVRESLELLVRWAGLQPEIFASAEEFLARPPVLVPSCLILDVNLPDLNGLDLQKRVAADRIDLPIIFITGYGDVPMTVQAMKAGAAEFLTKPFDDEVMLSAVLQAIERSRAAIEREAETRALRDRYESLTRREREVMALVASGLLNRPQAVPSSGSHRKGGRFLQVLCRRQREDAHIV
jgi:FixJ family two-component response regulator